MTVGGLPTLVATRTELARIMIEDCHRAQSEPGRLPPLVFSSNGQGIALAGRDADFARAMAEADIIHADGMSVVFASRLTKTPLPERIVTTDFFHDAARAASAHGLSFFMLGASEAVNAAAVETITRLYPQLRIAGRHHGYFDEGEDEDICRLIRASGADVLWLGLGKPRQEFWAVRNRERLAGLGWIKTCGGLQAYLAGTEKRAPAWMQQAGLEWLFRMLADPRRLAWRYFTTNPQALIRLFRDTERG